MAHSNLWTLKKRQSINKRNKNYKKLHRKKLKEMHMNRVLIFFIVVTMVSGENQQQISSVYRKIENDLKVSDTHIPFFNKTADSITECLMNEYKFTHTVEIKKANEKFICLYFTEVELSNMMKGGPDTDHFLYVYEVTESVSLTTDGEVMKPPDLCQNITTNKDGVYSVTLGVSSDLTSGGGDLSKNGGNFTEVFCDMTRNGGGWTTIQRRMDGSVDFNRNWQDYKNGFGKANGEYWLGLDRIYHITSQHGQNVLIRVEATTFADEHEFVIFKGFAIRSESHFCGTSV